MDISAEELQEVFREAVVAMKAGRQGQFPGIERGEELPFWFTLSKPHVKVIVPLLDRNGQLYRALLAEAKNHHREGKVEETEDSIIFIP